MLETTGDLLKNARKAKGLTQQEVADIVGVSRNQYIKWEKNQTDSIKSNVLCLLSNLLSIPIPELLSTRLVEGEVAEYDTIKDYMLENKPIITIDDLVKASNDMHPLSFLFQLAIQRLNLQMDDTLSSYFGMDKLKVLSILAGTRDTLKSYEVEAFCKLTKIRMIDLLSLGNMNGRNDTRVMYCGASNYFAFINLSNSHDKFIEVETERYAKSAFGSDMSMLVKLSKDLSADNMKKLLDMAMSLSREE